MPQISETKTIDIDVECFVQPTAATDLTALALGSSEIDLAWTNNEPNAELYEIYRGTTTGVLVLIDTTTDLDSYSDSGLTSDTQYFYAVKAVVDSNSSPFSNEATATTLYGIILTTTWDGVGDGAFTPAITYNGSDTPRWIFANGSILTGASISTTGNGLDGTSQNVVLEVGSTIGIQDFLFTDLKLSNVNFGSDSFTLDKFELNTNLLTAFTLANGTTVDTNVLLNTNQFTGLLDLSMIQTMSNVTLVDLRIGTAVTSINLFAPGSTSALNGDIRIQNLPVTTLDFTNILMKFTNWDLQNNTSLTSIIIAASSRCTNRINLLNCDLTGSVSLANVSMETLDSLDLEDNPLMTDVTGFGAGDVSRIIDFSRSDIGYIDLTDNDFDVNSLVLDLSDNSMTATEVNHYLVDADAESSGGPTGRVITIDGTNAAPDGASGGFDGLTAKTNLIAKGFTVTTN